MSKMVSGTIELVKDKNAETQIAFQLDLFQSTVSFNIVSLNFPLSI